MTEFEEMLIDVLKSVTCELREQIDFAEKNHELSKEARDLNRETTLRIRRMSDQLLAKSQGYGELQ